MLAGSTRTGKSALARLFLDASIPFYSPSASVARFIAATSRPTRRIRSCAANILLPFDSSQHDPNTTITATGTTKEDDTRVLCLELVDTPPLDVAAGPAALDRSLTQLLAFVEARFAKSDKPVSHFDYLLFFTFLLLYYLRPIHRLLTTESHPVRFFYFY